MPSGPKTPFANIIFDLDGTLIDSATITGQIIDGMLTDRGVAEQADRDLIKKMDAIGGEAMIAAVMGSNTVDPAADLADFRRRHRDIKVGLDVLFPQVAETIEKLADQGIGLAICSNKPQVLCEKILADVGLAHHFASIVGSAPERPRKPDPSGALLALGALCADTRSTLFCGDSVIDIETATAAGLSACLVAWGYGSALASKSYPDFPVIEDMTSLLALVQGGVN